MREGRRRGTECTSHRTPLRQEASGHDGGHTKVTPQAGDLQWALSCRVGAHGVSRSPDAMFTWLWKQATKRGVAPLRSRASNEAPRHSRAEARHRSWRLRGPRRGRIRSPGRRSPGRLLRRALSRWLRVGARGRRGGMKVISRSLRFGRYNTVQLEGVPAPQDSLGLPGEGESPLQPI